MRSPLRSRNEASIACRGSGSCPSSDRAMSGTLGPETRTTPMPPRPTGVAMAAMVSRATSSLGMGRLVAIEHALYLPLLDDGEDVVHKPVRSEEHTSELQSPCNLVCRLLLEKKKKTDELTLTNANKTCPKETLHAERLAGADDLACIDVVHLRAVCAVALCIAVCRADCSVLS